MTLITRLKDKPRLLLQFGQGALVLAFMSHLFLKPSGALSEQWTDAITGFLFGLAIGINLLAVALLSRRKGWR